MESNKCINHINWINSALKEENKLLLQEIKIRKQERQFILNRNYQSFNQTFLLYFKLHLTFEKGFRLSLNSIPINKQGLISLKEIYLKRMQYYYQKAVKEFNDSKIEIVAPFQLFESQNNKLKSMCKLINKLEYSMDYLIKLI